VAEWVEATWPDRRIPRTYNLKLGRLPEELIAALGIKPTYFTRARWFCDCVVEEPDKLVLIEGKIEQESSAVGQLLFYRWLIDRTQDFPYSKDKPRELVLLVTREIEDLELFAKEIGIQVEHYEPTWIMPHLERRTRR